MSDKSEEDDEEGYTPDKGFVRFIIFVLSLVFLALFRFFARHLSVIKTILVTTLTILVLACLVAIAYRGMDAEDATKILLPIEAKLKTWNQNGEIRRKNPYQQTPYMSVKQQFSHTAGWLWAQKQTLHEWVRKDRSDRSNNQSNEQQSTKNDE